MTSPKDWVSAALLASKDLKTLAQTSRTLFATRLARMMRLTGAASEEAMLADPATTWPRLKRSRSVKHTPHNHHLFLSAAVAAFKHVPGLADAHPDAGAAWGELQRDNWRAIGERYKDNEPSERQKTALVPFAEVLKARDALPRGHMTKLLLLFYTAIPPARGGDYHALRIHTGDTDTNTDPAANYLLLPAKGRCQLVLQTFKTSKRYGTITHVLPKEICQEVRASLRMHPREHVFGPFTRSGFSAWANRALKKQLGKAVTITMLRHLYVSQLDFNHLTLRELEEVSKQMGHKASMQAQYKWTDASTKTAEDDTKSSRSPQRTKL